VTRPPLAEGEQHVKLPPGRAFPPRTCEEQRELVLRIGGRVFVCAREPAAP